MNNILLEASTPALVKALEVNMHAQIPLYSHLPGAILWDEPDLLALLTDLDPSESMVYRTRFAPDEAEQRIEQVLHRFRIQGCLPMYWHVSPSTLPVDLGRYLLAQGFSLSMHPPAMVADLQELEKEPFIFDNFVIERIETEDELRQWVNIMAKADDISDALRDGFYQVFSYMRLEPEGDSQFFLGLENGNPVATSRLFCVGGVAGIWHVATLPEARGKGYGTAMTLAVARAGRERGYHFGVLYATPAGYGVYRHLGFQEVCHLDIYKSPD